MDFAQVAELCAPGVPLNTIERIAAVESGMNPYAIGVVGGRLIRQPKSQEEAVVTVKALADAGYNYSLGLLQVNQKHLSEFGLTAATAFDPCANVRAGSAIFQDCFRRAGGSASQLGDALSCYYSGNFKTGYREGYVAKVLQIDARAQRRPAPIPLAVSGGTRTATKTAKPNSPTSDTLFVSAASASTKTIATSDASPPLEANDTALLF